MTAAADLLEAAGLAPSNLQPLWAADTLRPAVIAFWEQASPTFPDQIPNNRPIGNWIAVIAAFAPTILDYDQAPPLTAPLGLGTLATYQQAVDYVYRLCKLAHALRAQGLITAPQATALLAAYNAHFA